MVKKISKNREKRNRAQARRAEENAAVTNDMAGKEASAAKPETGSGTLSHAARLRQGNAGDHLKTRCFGLLCLFQGMSWILFPAYTVPGRFGWILLAILVLLSAVFLYGAWFALRKDTLKNPNMIWWTALIALPVHGALTHFASADLFNFGPEQTVARLALGALLVLLTSGMLGDFLLLLLTGVLRKRVAGGTFAPDAAAFRAKYGWFDTLEALLIAFVLAMCVRVYVVQAFNIPSGSMEDTLLVGDYLMVNKFLYGVRAPVVDRELFALRAPERGDIIVFEFPEDAGKPWLKRRDFIKRVVGLPGDRVEMRAKQLYLNGEAVTIPQEVHKEPDLIPAASSPRDFFEAVTVPEGQYFVMGDNRDRSLDSRFWGFVDARAIKGRAWIKYWSWDKERTRPRWGRIFRTIE